MFTIEYFVLKMAHVRQSKSILGASDNGRKTNVWSTNKLSNELHAAVSVAFSVSSSVQSKMAKNAPKKVC